MQLTEQFRPTTWASVIGQSKAIATIDRLRQRGLAGRAFWISGQSGTGKTTIARLIAGELASPENILEIDGSELTDRRADEIAMRLRALPLFGRGQVVIINESHGLDKSAIRRLLKHTEAESIPSHACWIFTTTIEGGEIFSDKTDSDAFLSRCTSIPLSRRNLCDQFATAAVANCRSAGLLNGKPDEYYVQRAAGYLKKNGNNLRSLYQAAEGGYLTDSDE